jgi:hypothetical protein
MVLTSGNRPEDPETSDIVPRADLLEHLLVEDHDLNLGCRRYKVKLRMT